MNHVEYYRPRSLNEVWELRQKFPDALYISGGTDVAVQLKKRSIEPSALISLRCVAGLSGIKVGETTHIGATTTLAELIEHPHLGKIFPVLTAAAQRIGSVQIRNVGTIGGNLCNCSPCADTAPALLVLEAGAVIASPERIREVPLSEFFLGPGKSCLLGDEILTEIVLHTSGPAMFMKKSRVRMDLSLASVAALLHVEGGKCLRARFAAGSVAPVPLRLLKVEKFLEGSPITKDSIFQAQQLAMDSVSPITDIRSTAEYRRHIVGVYVKRAICHLAGWEEGQ